MANTKVPGFSHPQPSNPMPSGIGSFAVSRGAFQGHPTLRNNLVTAWPLDVDGRELLYGRALTNVNAATFVTKGTTAPSNMPDTVAHTVAASSQNFRLSSIDSYATFTAHDRTISAWVKPAAVGVVQGLMGFGETPLETSPCWFMRLNNNLLGTYNSAYSDGSIVVSALTWYHFVSVYEPAVAGSVRNKTYVNAVADVANTSSDNPTFLDTNFYIGAGFSGYAGCDYSGVYVWDRALSAAEASDLYFGGAGLFF